ncbi:hypothetical protein MLD38_033943 [Melastoma candidum]|uniref:Uncharacterized protein n=1 Tax=Melastoma candidum TaxID=119954 RepID=A0ACB9M8C4_9MYRT|nr:hypothetical protein MLD38_033943 [Melastoma candidum]
MTSEGLTVTQRDQLMVEQEVGKIYALFSELPPSSKSILLELQRDEHQEYLKRGLSILPPSFASLDANRPWLCYWILHSLALLDGYIEPEMEDAVVDFLSHCQDPGGGYGGGPGQMPHLATTYAAVNSLITLGGSRSLSSIDRGALYTFFRKMKQPIGGYRMHDGGEVDTRACYTAISVASILNLLDDELVKDVGSYILSCQTYEGGIAGEPGSEAHGGYTFCGLATMILIGEVDRLDLPRLVDWLVFRQGVECGFQGRTNKLVDGCYSFWQGGTLTLMESLHQLFHGDGLSDSSQSDASELSGDEGHATHDHSCSSHGPENTMASINLRDTSYNFIHGRRKGGPLFDSLALQQYILLCSQLRDGGLRDKPGKNRDFYHTCYCLSGLSASQYSSSKDLESAPLPQAVLGPYSNLTEPVHPLHNVLLSKYHDARDYFALG